MTCIICLGENRITTDNPLTDEHIVPEFMGGNLVVKNVCKICNSNLGNGFEGRLANSFDYKLARQVYGIKGKQKQAPNAFIGIYQSAQLGKVRVNDKNQVVIFPEVEIQEKDDKFSVTLTIDKTQEHQARNEITKKLIRHFKSQGKSLDKERISPLVDKLMEGSKIEKRVIEQPRVQGSFVLNAQDEILLRVKIVYELLVFHMGSLYLYDDYAARMRISLRQQETVEDLSFKFLNIPEFAHLFDSENHWVYIYQKYCVVVIFGMASSIVFTDESSDFFAGEGVVYKFDITSGKCLVRTFSEHLDSLA
ncbi:HNH endonuclease [Vibrio splendidus]